MNFYCTVYYLLVWKPCQHPIMGCIIRIVWLMLVATEMSSSAHGHRRRIVYRRPRITGIRVGDRVVHTFTKADEQ